MEPAVYAADEQGTVRQDRIGDEAVAGGERPVPLRFARSGVECEQLAVDGGDVQDVARQEGSGPHGGAAVERAVPGGRPRLQVQGVHVPVLGRRVDGRVAGGQAGDDGARRVERLVPDRGAVRQAKRVDLAVVGPEVDVAAADDRRTVYRLQLYLRLLVAAGKRPDPGEVVCLEGGKLPLISAGHENGAIGVGDGAGPALRVVLLDAAGGGEHGQGE